MLRPLCKMALGLGLACQGASAQVTQVPPVAGTSVPEPVAPWQMPALKPAVIDNALLIGGQDINARKVDTRMTVEVRVNGRGPYRFLVDSGADSSVIGMRVARDLQLAAGTSVMLNSMTARTLVPRALVDEISLGAITIRDLQLPVLREQDLGGDGIIGIDALVQHRLMLDFEKRVIKVEDARTPSVMVRGEIVVTARRRRGQLILTEVHAAGRALKAVIDTGSEITIGNLKLRDKLIRGNREKFAAVVATDVTGATINLQMAVVETLELGSVMLRDVPIAFGDVPPFGLFGLDEEPALLLGTDLLNTFRRVSLDFRARKVRFQLRRCGSTSINIGTATQSRSRISSEDREVCVR